MNCKDCLHYEACKNTYNIQRSTIGWIAEFDEEEFADTFCDKFTNRSEWLHLPCKVGDKLYKVVPDFAKPRGSLKIQEYTVVDTEIVVRVDNPYNVFEGHRIGGDVFLTREKAEKALEGMK